MLLKKEALSGRLKFYDHVHFVSWQVLLGVLSSSCEASGTQKCWEKWEDEIKAWRQDYANLKSELVINPHHGDDSDAHDATNDNPLSNSESSTWAQYFANSELRKDIWRDVDRTYPEIDFFREQKVQELLTMVLFVYAKQHPALAYKQGMHEILALPFYIAHRERVEHLSAEKYTPDSSASNYSSLIKALYDPEYMEHDLYRLFSKMLERLGPFYHQSRNGMTSPNMNGTGDAPSGGAGSGEEGNSSSTNGNGSAVLRKCKLIQDVLLKKHDEQLSIHLSDIELEPQLYLLRWIRILFGREFHLEDTVTVWDAIFAFDDHFGFIDHMAVAMLIFIRGQLLSRDFADCIKRLQKYPPVEDVTILVEHAIALTKPKPAGLVGPLPFPSSLPHPSSSSSSSPSTTLFSTPSPSISVPQQQTTAPLVTVSGSSKPATSAPSSQSYSATNNNNAMSRQVQTPQKPIVYASPAYNTQIQQPPSSSSSKPSSTSSTSSTSSSSSSSSSIFGGALTGGNSAKRTTTSNASDAQILKATPLHTPPAGSKSHHHHHHPHPQHQVHASSHTSSNASMTNGAKSNLDSQYVTVPKAEWEELNRKAADQNLRETKFTDKLTSVISSLQGILTSMSDELTPQQVQEVLVMTVAGLKKTRDVASGLLQDDEEGGTSPIEAFAAMSQQVVKQQQKQQQQQSHPSTTTSTSASSSKSHAHHSSPASYTSSSTTTNVAGVSGSTTPPSSQPTTTTPPTATMASTDILGMLPPADTDEWVFAPVAVTGNSSGGNGSGGPSPSSSTPVNRGSTASPVRIEIQASSEASKAAVSAIFD